jgi:hypothetical protein
MSFVQIVVNYMPRLALNRAPEDSELTGVMFFTTIKNVMVNLMSFKCSEDKPINKQPEERTG